MVWIKSSMYSSKEEKVNITVVGLAETIRMLKEAYKLVPTYTGMTIVNAADLYKNEVQASIMGLRGEYRSVDTGAFANSLKIMPGDGGLIVYTDIPYAKWLEYGVSDNPARQLKTGPRMHFTNTLFNVKPMIKDIAKMNIKSWDEEVDKLGVHIS